MLKTSSIQILISKKVDEQCTGASKKTAVTCCDAHRPSANIMAKFTVVAALLCLTPCAGWSHGNQIDWDDQFAFEPVHFADADMSVTFEWTGEHNVELMASEEAYNNCDFTGAAAIGSLSGVQVTGNDGEVHYYGCSVGSHCASGQKVAITWEHADHDDHDTDPTDEEADLSDACQHENSHPLYCTEAEANLVSPDGSSHSKGDHYMPDGVTFFHGDYTGDADECACEESDDGHAGHDDHDHDEEEEVDAASRAMPVGALVAAAAAVFAF